MRTHKKDYLERLIKQAIVLSIDSIREEISKTVDDNENLNRSQAILNLVQAFAIVGGSSERCRACGTGDARETAEDIPAADVRENVLGEWVDDGFLNRKTCSICGAWIANNTGTAELNYCPNCGADMRGDNNGKN